MNKAELERRIDRLTGTQARMALYYLLYKDTPVNIEQAVALAEKLPTSPGITAMCVIKKLNELAQQDSACADIPRGDYATIVAQAALRATRRQGEQA